MKRRLVAIVLGLAATLGVVGGVAAAAQPDAAPVVVAGSSWS